MPPAGKTRDDISNAYADVSRVPTQFCKSQHNKPVYKLNAFHSITSSSSHAALQNRSPSPPALLHTQPSGKNSPAIDALIRALSLQPHLEGGYFHETDRAPDTVPSPFPSKPSNTSTFAPQRPGFDPAVRNASTTIFYLLTPNSPLGGFHRNAARTVHTLHRGRGRYVIIHADEESGSGSGSGGEGKGKMVETFVVGRDVERGERLQWVVSGGKYKASFLLPDVEDGNGGSEAGLLISETVVPGFEFCDHDFLDGEGLKELVGEEKARELKWLLKST